MRGLQSSEDYIKFHRLDYYLADAVQAVPAGDHLYALAAYFVSVTRGTHGAGREYAYTAGA